MSAVRAWAMMDEAGNVLAETVRKSEIGARYAYNLSVSAKHYPAGHTCVEVEVRELSSPEQDAGLLKAAEAMAGTGASAMHIVELIRAALSRREAGK